MKLIVGLGNPGAKYQLTRHNIGFMLIDALSQAGPGDFKSEHRALTKKVTLAGEVCLLAKPQTYMNLSGESVRPLLDYYKMAETDLLVAHDEIEIPFGEMRIQIRRGAAGHNGIKSLHQMLGTDAYARLRMGVGRPSHPQQQVVDYVLENFSKSEFDQMPDFLTRAAEATECFVREGVARAANKYNTKAKES